MYGLVVLIGLFLYAFLCYLFVRFARRWRPERKLLMGWLTFILFNAPLGYQIIPGMIVRSIACNNQAGFWLYKTPEQWKAENPGVAETLTLNGKQENRKIREGESERIFHLNQRFDWVNNFRYEAKNVIREEQTVVDTQTGEVMARKVDFHGQGPSFLGGGSSGGCFKEEEREKWRVNGKIFIKYKRIFQFLGEKG